jgi:hypothetical protein
MELKSENLIYSSSNREVYRVGDVVYKKAKNLLGLWSNKSELQISKRNYNCLSFYKVTDDDMIIKTNYIDIYNEEDKYKKIFGQTKSELSVLCNIFYFNNNEQRMKNRLSEKSIQIFKEEYVSYKNKKYNKNILSLINIINRENLEPNDLVRSIHFYKNSYWLYDFGLTEQNYFNNMFILEITKDKDNYGKTERSTICLFKNFNGEYEINDEQCFKDVTEYYELPIEEIVEEYNTIKPGNNRLVYCVEEDEFFDSKEL